MCTKRSRDHQALKDYIGILVDPWKYSCQCLNNWSKTCFYLFHLFIYFYLFIYLFIYLCTYLFAYLFISPFVILERFQVLKINIIQGKCFLFNTTNDLKIAPTSICKAAYQIEMENFRAISVLRSFLNMFERIICVLLFKICNST